MTIYFRLAWRVVKKLIEDEVTHLAAGVAYYATLSLFPLLLGVLAVAGMIWDSESLERNFVDIIAANLPGSRDLLTENTAHIERYRGALGIAAILGLLWSGSATFGAIARAMDRVWGTTKSIPFYISKPFHVVMAAVTGALFMFSAGATTLIEILSERSQELGVPSLDSLVGIEVIDLALRVVPAGITLLVFVLIYRYAPNPRTDWKFVWPGALAAAVLFEAAKSLFVWYLNNLAIYTQVHSLLTSIMSLLLWIYASSFILILGAEISSEYAKMQRRAS